MLIAVSLVSFSVWGGGVKQRGRKVDPHIRFGTRIAPNLFEIDFETDIYMKTTTTQSHNTKPKTKVTLAQINCYRLLSIDILHSDKDINNVSSNRG